MFFFKSPLAYTGNKYRQLGKLSELMPKSIYRFFDVFGGGADMANIPSKIYIYNELQTTTYKVAKEMHYNDNFYNDVVRLKREHGISKRVEDKENFYKLRDKHNKNALFNPIERFLLIKHSFNSQNRENRKGEFNNPFAGNKIGINFKGLKEFLAFFQKKEALFFNMDFREFLQVATRGLYYSDFIYLDPPYRITEAYYNNGWGEHEDISLFSKLDTLNRDGIRWGLSNVISHRGVTNKELKEWSKDYQVTYLKEFDYSKTNFNKHTSKRSNETVEVFITNYDVNSHDKKLLWQ